MHMMCGLMKEEEGQGECSTHHQMDMQAYQQQLMLLQHHQLHEMEQHQPTPSFYNATCEGGRAGDLIFPPPDIPSNPWSLPPPVHDTFLVPPQPVAAGLNLYHRPRGCPPASSLQFPYEGQPSSSDHIRILSEALCPVIQPGSNPFGLQAELGKMTAQEIMDAKALAASKSHSEAERRRRERINNHLAKLRSLIPNTPKTDKASLLAEVIHHVKELKRQTSLIAESSPVPTEVDELTVDAAEEDGKLVIKASLCCEDRPDLLPDLIKALKELRLRTLKAEITTLGGRVKNVLFITGDQEEEEGEEEPQVQCAISAIQEALKAVMEKAAGAGDNQHHDQSSSGIVKRQRTTNSVNIYP